jgi:two-component system chemotaxis sensor kinase CheA
MVMPLSMVARLEEFEREQVEYAGNQPVVQYRGELLPLVDLSSALPSQRRSSRPPQSDGTSLQVVVYTEGGRSVGVVVDRIIDIVDEVLTVKQQGTRDGVLGVTVIQNKVTEILDVSGVIRRAYPAFYKSQSFGMVAV